MAVFFVAPASHSPNKQAVENLESVAKDVSQDPAELLGDWTLVCTTASSSALQGLGGGIDTKNLPFFNEGEVEIAYSFVLAPSARMVMKVQGNCETEIVLTFVVCFCFTSYQRSY